jgi:hypothetical protein
MKHINHPLPETPTDLRPLFERLCQAYNPDQLPQLKAGVAHALRRMAGSVVQDYLGPDCSRAAEIAQRLSYLIDNCKSFPPESQHLVIGAIAYFMLQRDSLPDLTPIVGLDDDCRVVNYVLEQLGVEGMFLEI